LFFSKRSKALKKINIFSKRMEYFLADVKRAMCELLSEENTILNIIVLSAFISPLRQRFQKKIGFS